jgi:hypothetical protein
LTGPKPLRDHDASAYVRVDANTVIFSRFKAGKFLAVGTGVLSQDGKTWSVGISVHEKQ